MRAYEIEYQLIDDTIKTVIVIAETQAIAHRYCNESEGECIKVLRSGALCGGTVIPLHTQKPARTD